MYVEVCLWICMWRCVHGYVCGGVDGYIGEVCIMGCVCGGVSVSGGGVCVWCVQASVRKSVSVRMCMDGIYREGVYVEGCVWVYV